MLPTDKPIRETSPLLPSLSTKGWISGMYEKVDKIYAYYFTSLYNQTVYHLGNVRSLQKTIKENMSSPHQLAMTIKEDLETLLKPYVDHVEVTVNWQQIDETHRYDYHIEMMIIHAGYQWRQFKGIHMDESNFEEIATINNTGGASLV